jgi:hypothetical protein
MKIDEIQTKNTKRSKANVWCQFQLSTVLKRAQRQVG